MLRNDSEGEVHEILAFLLPDDEDRPVEDLMELPEDELRALLMDMRGVALAPPDEVMAAVQAFIEAGGGPDGPDYPQTGPPHFANGMFAEVFVR